MSSNRKSPSARELYRERDTARRERVAERKCARDRKRVERVSFGGAR